MDWVGTPQIPVQIYAQRVPRGSIKAKLGLWSVSTAPLADTWPALVQANAVGVRLANILPLKAKTIRQLVRHVYLDFIAVTEHLIAKCVLSVSLVSWVLQHAQIRCVFLVDILHLLGHVGTYVLPVQ